MKIATHLLFLLVSFLNISRAAENPSLNAPHVGGTSYPLGTKARPVTANEYCAFLNSTRDALIYYREGYSECFYDRYFMNVTHLNHYQALSEDNKIYKETCITRYNEYHYRYAVIPGRGNYIIDGLSWGHWFDSLIDVVNLFNNWRVNPTSQEICDYLNHKKTGNEKITELFHDYYLSASTFNDIDHIAFEANSSDPSFLAQERFFDERGRSIFTFSAAPDSSSVIASPLPGMEYYRPSAIQISLK